MLVTDIQTDICPRCLYDYCRAGLNRLLSAPGTCRLCLLLFRPHTLYVIRGFVEPAGGLTFPWISQNADPRTPVQLCPWRLQSVFNEKIVTQYYLIKSTDDYITVINPTLHQQNEMLSYTQRTTYTVVIFYPEWLNVCKIFLTFFACRKQEGRAVAKKLRDAACFAYTQWLFDCYLHSLYKSRC